MEIKKFTDKERTLILHDITNKIISNCKNKGYSDFNNLDEEDLARLSVINKIHPTMFSWAKAKIEDWITKGD